MVALGKYFNKTLLAAKYKVFPRINQVYYSGLLSKQHIYSKTKLKHKLITRVINLIKLGGLGGETCWSNSWTNFSLQDEPWAEFSTLEVAACVTMHLRSGVAKQPNLELKTQPKQLLGSLPLVIALPV